MHTIVLAGGLGNQIFMIFAVLGYGIQYKLPFYFETHPIVLGTRKKEYWDTLFVNFARFRRPISTSVIQREVNFGYNPIPYYPPDFCFKLYGYFQSYKYFHDYRTEIFQIMELENIKNTVRDKVKEEYNNWENSVSLHFRIGDYKKNPDYHPILPITYYEKALTKLIEDTGRDDWTILIYGEEEDKKIIVQHVNQLIRQFTSLNFKRLHIQLDDYEEMLTMSLCRHHIIANSSFSYFGAYFNTHEGGNIQVYYPSVWLGHAFQKKNKNDEDRCLPSWTKIDAL